MSEKVVSIKGKLAESSTRNPKKNVMHVQVVDEQGQIIWSQDSDSSFCGAPTEYLNDGTMKKIVTVLGFATACAASL